MSAQGRRRTHAAQVGRQLGEAQVGRQRAAHTAHTGARATPHTHHTHTPHTTPHRGSSGKRERWAQRDAGRKDGQRQGQTTQTQAHTLMAVRLTAWSRTSAPPVPRTEASRRWSASGRPRRHLHSRPQSPATITTNDAQDATLSPSSPPPHPLPPTGDASLSRTRPRLNAAFGCFRPGRLGGGGGGGLPRGAHLLREAEVRNFGDQRPAQTILMHEPRASQPNRRDNPSSGGGESRQLQRALRRGCPRTRRAPRRAA